MNNDKTTPQITTAKMVTRGDKKKGKQETDSKYKRSCSSKKHMKDQHQAKTTDSPSGSNTLLNLLVKSSLKRLFSTEMKNGKAC